MNVPYRKDTIFNRHLKGKQKAKTTSTQIEKSVKIFVYFFLSASLVLATNLSLGCTCIVFLI